MTSEQLDRRAMQIFSLAVGLSASERLALLDRECQQDAQLRQRVQGMLEADNSEDAAIGADAQIDGFLANQVKAVLPGFELSSDSGGPPTGDGEYTILRVIGEGGMGTVYEAEQNNPRRRVAIKAIRPGRITPQMRKRFEYEAQVLARLEHVGIARLYEFNTQNEAGRIRAFLAMELVLGEQIDAYAVSHILNVRERLRLFIKVCDAIAYAHRMGVIHRDLKPANILVDQDGQPKVLDFGVAVAAEGHNFVTTITEHGQLIGTLAYMSPEQVEGKQTIDTRADVYSLGVILYKLLTGVLPIATDGANLVSLTQGLLSETPKKLGEHDKRLRGDLEIIVGRALEKEPARRYASVDQLRDEITRYLAGRPIEARGDSALYRLRKAVWRHRIGVGMVVVLMLVVLGFGIQATIQSSHNRKLAQAAEHARGEATTQASALRRSLYFNNIGFAQSALDNNDMERAHRLLDGCEPDLRGWEWSYLQRLCDLSIQTTALNLDRPRYASFSRDGSMVALATLDRQVLLRKSNGQELLRVTLTDGTARAALSPDGKWLAYGCVSQCVYLMNVTTGERRELKAEVPTTTDSSQRGLRAISFSNDSDKLAVVGLDRVLRVWEIPSGKRRRTIDLGRGQPICMLLSRAGDWAAIGDAGGRIRLFDTRSSQLLRTLEGHDAPVWSLALSSDGKRLASGDNDGRAIVWDVDKAHPLVQLDQNDGWITTMCFSPDGETLAQGRADSTIRLLHLPDASTAGVLRGHRHAVVYVDWQPNGTLHTISLDGTAKTWNADSALQVPTIATGQPQSNGLAFGPDGHSIFVGGSDGSVRSWQIPAEDEPIKRVHRLSDHQGQVLEIAINSTTGLICTASRDGVAHISNLTNPSASRTIAPNTGAISGIDFSPDGSSLILATSGELSLWDVSNGKKLRDYSAPGLVANELIFDPTGSYFYGACADGHVRKWRVDSPTPVAQAMIDPAGLYDVKLSPDRRMIVVTGDTQSVALLDAQTLQPIRRYTGHQGGVLGAAFHPDGQRLATCGNDRTIRIWDLQTATELIALRGHRRGVQHIGFSLDGALLASTSDDGTVKIWRTLPR
jgi:eukaryotic-like serine/threonine-protein kinase